MTQAPTPPEPPKPVCGCCGGSGMHGYRPYVAPSPDDDDIECSVCAGTGETWFDPNRNSCAGYRDLYRGRR